MASSATSQALSWALAGPHYRLPQLGPAGALEGTCPLAQYPQALHDVGDPGTSQRSVREDPVTMVYQKPEALNQTELIV